MSKEDNNLSEIGNEIRDFEFQYKKEIEPYRKDLWRYCYSLTGSPWDAEDLVQDTLLKAFSMLSKIYQTLNTKSYIFKIATNLWIDNYRKQKLDFQYHYNLNLLLDNKTDNELLVYENIEYLSNRLSTIQFVTLILSDVFLYKAKEVAEIINSSPEAVYANLNRARKTLKQREHYTSDKKRKNDYTEIQLTNKVLERLINGFRNKDPEQIASVLNENIQTDIVHSGIEYGKNETTKNSLKDWAIIANKQQQIVVKYIELWGKPVVIELENKEGDLYLNNIHDVLIEDESIVLWKFYCFSWDLMNIAADLLGVKLNAAYYYNIF